MTLEKLVDSLSTLGIAHEVRRSGADGAILLLPEYGRVLGVWPHWRGENALWVNPDFIQSLRAGAKDDGWRNPGGDRIWLAPAGEFLGEGGAVPPAIDPGRFVLSSDRGAACMANRGEAWARLSAVRVRFRLTRRVSPLDEAGLAAAWGPSWLRRAGFEEEIELEIQGKSAVPAQLWNFAQVPPGSQILPAEPLTAEGRTILCLEDPDSERARLLVKSYAAAGEENAPAAPGRGRASSGSPAELSCSSPPVEPGARRRLKWKTSLCAFSGRSVEIRQLASRMLYSTYTKE